MKFSAHTELNGVTVFEPMILNEPDNVDVAVEVVVVSVEDELQPVRTNAITSIGTSGKNHFLKDLFKFSLLSII
jgi:hypothetical protein